MPLCARHAGETQRSAPILLLPVIYLLMLVATAVSLAVKHRSACALWAAPALFLMHNCFGAGFLTQLILRGRGAK